MVLCAVIKCNNRSGATTGVSYFGFPNIIENKGMKIKEFSKNRRKEWLSRVSRADLSEDNLKNKKCSEHFVHGKPSDLMEITHPDWAPSLKLGHDKFKLNPSQVNDRYKRSFHRKLSSSVSTVSASCPQSLGTSSSVVPTSTISTSCTVSTQGNLQNTAILSPAPPSPLPVSPNYADASVQTDNTIEYISQLEMEVNNLRKEKNDLQKELNQSKLSSKNLDDSKIQFYTGLPSMNMFEVVYNFVSPRIQYRPVAVDLKESFLMFLMKLRLNLLMQDLAYRFSVSQSTVNRLFHAWLDATFISMSSTIIWPERDALRETMPTDFKMVFGTSVAVILDCFEIMIDRPTSLITRAATWSNYKHHNTIKILVGISPQGVITFVSDAWGGRQSDKYITEHCGILEKLLPGDYVMADRGFNIEESVGLYCARLIKPASARGKKQLSPNDIQDTRKLASLRIEIERVIGNLRQKYTILKGQLPVEYLTLKEGDNCTAIDKILKVCASFTNLSRPIVSLI